jgi:hypothetical protein
MNAVLFRKTSRDDSHMTELSRCDTVQAAAMLKVEIF